MNGFASVIRDIVRAEVQPKRIDDLLGRRPLRVGLNRGQFFLFEEGKSTGEEGFFPDLMRSLALSLHCEIEFRHVAHADFNEKLQSGEIDCFGPIYRSVPRLSQALFMKPFCTVPIAGIGRTKSAAQLVDLPLPKRIADLRKKEYVVAVHQDSMAHHFAISELGIPEERIVACEAPDEALERVMLSKIPRPAHLILADAPFAIRAKDEHGSAVAMLFEDGAGDLAYFEDTIAVRPDWPPLLGLLDQALDLLRRGGALRRLYEKSGASKRDEMLLIE
jgi:hypothetical protein